ncbi:hypothetical protein F5050DRAFT_1741046 [Lentinula boryana]|uniref:Uncharacterized protein n=1 Tax=Lentinula boryana TaxID=40481 RepID=A0ABQ8QK62_9AGAR|nr:hypothetical protein F5050DRAFT_1741046 [Lentinula boryana]
MILSQSISYILLGLVALTQTAAGPIDVGVVFFLPFVHPAYFFNAVITIRAYTLLNYLNFLQTRSSSSPLDVIYIHFRGDLGGGVDHTTKGIPRRDIALEIDLIMKAYRNSIGITTPFRFEYQNSYNGHISRNEHDFDFWGERVGEDCEEEDPMKIKNRCMVVFHYTEAEPTDDRKVDAGKDLATVFFDTKNLFTVHYDIRHQVLTG